MKESYENRIFANTGEEIHHNALARRVKGDKKRIGDVIHELVDSGYLIMRKEKNQNFYKRNDKIPSEVNFNYLMKSHQWNYDQISEEIKKIPKLTTKKGRVSKRAKYLIWHTEYLTNDSMTMIIRTNYQMNLGLIPNRTAQRRIGIINEMISEIMKEIKMKYENEMSLVRELFQNHSKEFKFKI